MIDNLIHVALLLTLPPLLQGVITKVKALFAGRVGPSVLQPYFDIARLLRKGTVISRTTTSVFRLSPAVTLSTAIAAGLLVPVNRFAAPIGFAGDLVVFVSLFALARFFTALAALDTGSPFEGMGAAREVTFACLSEPALFFALLVLANISGSLSLTDMLRVPLARAWGGSVAPLVLVAAGLFVLLLAENCRIPVDDPNTHLELTMIHEVMVLDHSGPLLGFILYGAAVKLYVLSAFILHLLAPFETGSRALDWALSVGQMLSLATVIGVVESVMARLQMRHVPTFLIAACLLCGFGFLLLVR